MGINLSVAECRSRFEADEARADDHGSGTWLRAIDEGPIARQQRWVVGFKENGKSPSQIPCLDW